MEYLALYAYEFACTAVPAFIAYLALKRRKRNRRNADAPSAALATVFAVYLFALLHFTGAGTLHDTLRFGLDPNPHQMNLIPFANFSEDVEGHLLNVLLFVPLGLLTSLFCENRHGILPVAAMAFAASLVIEVSQLLNSRVTDVDDLIMNVIGTLIGYGAFKLVEQKKKGRSAKVLGMDSAVAMIVSAFLGRFLLYNEIGLAKVLFGF